MTSDQDCRSFEWMAERELTLRDGATGNERRITIQIGRPYWVKEHVQAACPVAIDGLLERRKDIRGMDTLNALTSAIKFVETYLSKPPRGCTIHWLNGDTYPE